MSFRDREAGGALLAEALARYARRPDLAVLGLVRGGVPVAATVARRLEAPLDALVVRKLGVPWEPEVAFGALGSEGVCVLNQDIAAQVPPETVAGVLRREALELRRREQRYRGGRPRLHLRGQVVVLVDDGLATGASARAGVAVTRRLGARWVVVAAPVGSPFAVDQLLEVADEVVCPVQPPDFDAVSCWYEDFDQVSDAEVEALLTWV
ncbi:phosphoribosyltransferase [Planosporangium flavigriseum]|uniref:Phosphoribosyltransferase n=1 Tax=Planosporangium flavigriseum TaxID=373681 RepID=A0A8J3PKC9_9ACTN|nr:phosphoribosyltransferase family protein [Planosporangium flavigriseum]NJC64503.1 phosphoribosyltransferase [Planosporangium flavigriseum]GIG72019.1 phosphoribosyltransferase [Planosporangium flavigriseum]